MKQEVLKVQEATSTDPELVAELVKRLPIRLRATVRAEVLKAALQEGLLSVDDEGRWHYMLENKTLLAYFCGRMWCGDTPVYSKCTRGYVWQEGEGCFPRKEVEELFGVSNLRLVRKKRFMAQLPAGWELIEKIFGGGTK